MYLLSRVRDVRDYSTEDLLRTRYCEFSAMAGTNTLFSVLQRYSRKSTGQIELQEQVDPVHFQIATYDWLLGPISRHYDQSG